MHFLQLLHRTFLPTVRCIADRNAPPRRLHALLCVLGCLAAAQSPAEAGPGPCDEAEYRQFDFWVGDFEVRTAEDQLAGENHIVKAEQGCLLIENWQGAKGGTGQSYNFYEPGTGRWRQVWVSQGAVIDIQGGLVKEEDGTRSMLLEGVIRYRADGREAGFRGRWTPLVDGVVRQFFEEQQDDGTWGTWFEGFYRPKADPDSALTPAAPPAP